MQLCTSAAPQTPPTSGRTMYNYRLVLDQTMASAFSLLNTRKKYSNFLFLYPLTPRPWTDYPLAVTFSGFRTIPRSISKRDGPVSNLECPRQRSSFVDVISEIGIDDVPVNSSPNSGTAIWPRLTPWIQFHSAIITLCCRNARRFR